MTPQLIQKLQKILALTTSPVEGEAQAAAFKLQQLLTEHNLEIADLEQRGHISAPGVIEQQHDLGKAAFKWKLELADLIAEHFYCISITNAYGRWKEKDVKFAGRPDNVESLGMLYKWLVQQIKLISAEKRKEHHAKTGSHIDPLRWQVSFGTGIVDRLGDRLEEIMKRKQEQAADEAQGALVIHHDSENNDYMEQKYGYRADGKATAKEKARRAERDAREQEMQDLKKSDPEAYYRARPWERPLTPEQQAAKDKADAQAQKREERNARRRKGRSYTGYRKFVDRAVENQKNAARTAGNHAAKEINLEPFLKGGKTTISKPTAKLR